MYIYSSRKNKDIRASRYVEVASKEVTDSDGFLTDYTMYTNGETYICMFGDKDIYEPDEAYADYETENEQDAWDRFNSYVGLTEKEDEDDIYGSEDLEKGVNSEDALWDVIDDEDFEFHGIQDVGYDDSGNIMVILNDGISRDIIESTAEELLIAFRQYGYPVHEWNTYGPNLLILSRGGILSSTDSDSINLELPEQEYKSEKTSINAKKLPAIFKLVTFNDGTVNLDFGGGRFDNVQEYFDESGKDIRNLVLDPYNRSSEHNQSVIRDIKEHGGADTATCSNVLNVIKEPEARLAALRNIKKLVKPGGDVYITVYEGSKTGDAGPTKSGFQLNRSTADYLDEVREVFPDAERKGKLIVAHNS